MALIYQFPRLEAIDQLLAKKYVDQAICALEDGLPLIGALEEKKAWQKKLLSCYLLKKEYDSCEAIILQLKQMDRLDLEVAAHDIVIGLVQNHTDKQAEYQEQLALSGFAYKNLIELVFNLKHFYEQEWLEEAGKKFQALSNSDSFEKTVIALGALMQIETIYFDHYQEHLHRFLAMDHHPILKIMLFELLCQKEVALEVAFKSEGQIRTLSTKSENLPDFYQAIFPFCEGVDAEMLIQKLLNDYGGN